MQQIGIIRANQIKLLIHIGIFLKRVKREVAQFV